MKIEELTDEQFEKIDRVVKQVWQEIGGDIEASYLGSDSPSPLNNNVAVEACLDVGRPAEFCGKEGREVDKLINELQKEEDLDDIYYNISRRNRLL